MAERARWDAAALGDQLHQIRTTGLVALAAALDGHVETAGAASTNAAHAADAMPDDQFVEDPNVLSTLATAEFYLDRVPRGERARRTRTDRGASLRSRSVRATAPLVRSHP